MNSPRPLRTVLENGIRLLSIPVPGVRTATVLVLVHTGALHESNEENGLAHFLEHLCFKGTTRRPGPQALAEEFDRMGAEYNAFTSLEYTGYYVKCAANEVLHALDIVADLFLDPLLRAEDIEKERGVIRDEIGMYEGQPGHRLARLFDTTLYGDQPLGRPVTGTKETVRSVPREAILRYRKHQYVGKNVVVAVAGSFPKARIEKEVRRRFEGVPSGKAARLPRTTPILPGVEVVQEKKEDDQIRLKIGFPGVRRGDRREAALSMLGGVLSIGMSGRLFRRLREEMGVGYSVGTGRTSHHDHGIFTVGTGVSPDRIEEVVRAIGEELGVLCTTLVPEDELAKVREGLIGRLNMGVETSDEVADYYAFQELLRGTAETPEEYVARLLAVTREDIRTIARTVFDPARVLVALYGPACNTKAVRKALLAGLAAGK